MYTEEELDRVIFAQDLQVHGFCIKGVRHLWRANPHLENGKTFEDFIKKGMTVRWALGTENPYALTLVNLVLGRNNGC